MWFREQLNELGCSDVMLTPFCKGDPAELTPLARLKVINAMPPVPTTAFRRCVC